MIRSFDLTDGSTVTAIKTEGNGKGTREYTVMRDGVCSRLQGRQGSQERLCD